MPVTVKPTSHKANLVKMGPAHCSNPIRKLSPPSFSPNDLLQEACPTEHKRCKELLQSSFTFDQQAPTVGSPNGFVYSAIQAWNNHYNLVIRPEDVWFAILTQLSAYINRHAEELRGKFVPFEGKKELVVDYPSDTRLLLEANIIDKELREWIMPAFTTTTANDVVVGSILMMGAMQHYFSFKGRTGCALPSVTLLGEKGDWERILARLEKLPTFSEEPTQWSRLLKPILSRFTASYDTPHAADVHLFWNRIAHYKGGSGSKYYSGWITAFCFWDDKGRCMYYPRTGSNPSDDEYYDSESEVDSDGNFRLKSHDLTDPAVVKGLAEKRAWEKNLAPVLELDGVYYHYIETDDVPMGFSVVPVKIEDNNAGYNCTANMIAGSVGIKCSSSGDLLEDGKVRLDTVQAESGWWIFEAK